MATPQTAHLFITTGPESCGKTTLAQALSAEWQAPLVSEAARAYLHRRFEQDGHFRYHQADLTAIAGEQYALEQEALQQPVPFVVCDTDLLVILVWSEVKYGNVDPVITELFTRSIATTRRTYLLCDFHVPWEPDPLREDPDNRAELFARYRDKLDHYGLDYRVVTGDVPARLALVNELTSSSGGGCPCCID
ncbi:MAG TPA: ATP-binding protein [Candidatus Acidoferrum sp.]|nr:ATP-binding protein [Candidatus Acidoferrum sp.]